MRYAKIVDGTVANVIEAHDNYAKQHALVQSDVALIGDTFVDGRFYRDGELVLTDAERYQQYYDGMQEVLHNE